MRFLVDTNVLSEAVKRAPNPGVLARCKASEGVAALSAVTWQELRYGTRRLPESRRREALEVWVHGLLGRSRCCRRTSLLRNGTHVSVPGSRGVGLRPPFADGQIAATATADGLLLVTRNVADLQGFSGLEVQTWW